MRYNHLNRLTRDLRPGLMTASATTLLAGLLAGAAHAQTFENGVWTPQATTTLQSLTIPEGGSIRAPDGKTVTLTVNGVDTALRPGSYSGNIVINVADGIPVTYHALPTVQFRTGVYINDGHYDPAHSNPAAVSGQIGDSEASDLSITSDSEKFNGVIVTGDSRYTIDNATIDMTGNGGNDFAGYGAAIMASGNADLTVNNAKIHTKGAVRTAVFVGGHAVVHVNNADIFVENGKLPPDYRFTIEVGRMMEVPWMLGLSGNVRATNLVDHGTVYYTHSHIRTQGWGALSADDAAVVRMYVKDSLVETLDSGYGAYSIGDSLDSFDHSVLKVADVGVIMAGPGSATFTNGTTVTSRRYGVMMHSGGGGGLLTIDKGSVVTTRSTAIEIKGRGGNVLIDDAKIYAGNGILLQAMINDDPFASGPPPGAAGPSGVVGIQGAPAMEKKPGEDDVHATIRNATLDGDLINTRTQQGAMTVTLENATLNGAISTGTQAPVSGEAPTQATYWLIGNVVNTLGATPDKTGVSVTVGKGATWVVTRTSYITDLNIAPGGAVKAPAGYRVSLSRNGKAVALRPGHYAGALTLTTSALR